VNKSISRIGKFSDDFGSLFLLAAKISAVFTVGILGVVLFSPREIEFFMIGFVLISFPSALLPTMFVCVTIYIVLAGLNIIGIGRSPIGGRLLGAFLGGLLTVGFVPPASLVFGAVPGWFIGKIRANRLRLSRGEEAHD